LIIFVNDGGNFTLGITKVTPASNDTCAAPVALTLNQSITLNFASAPVAVARPTVCLIEDSGLTAAWAGSAAGNPDLTYTFTAPSTGNFLITTTDADIEGTPPDFWMSDGSCGAATCLGQSAIDASYNQQFAVVPMTAGHVYAIVVAQPGAALPLQLNPSTRSFSLRVASWL
jgi:hypothetical protein